MQPDLVGILVGGTLAVDIAADLYYAPVARLFGRARILTLPSYGTDSVNHTAEKLNKKFARDYPGSYIAAICHSQSGLEVAQCALDNPMIVQIATVGTPFHGTPVALAGWPLIRATSDMLPGSRYLRGLSRRLPELTSRNCLATVSLRHDRIVPWPSSRVDGARNYFCGTVAECRSAKRKFRDTRPVVVTESRYTGHIMGLQMLQPALVQLLAVLWRNAIVSAARDMR
jgi:hypothetical protein